MSNEKIYWSCDKIRKTFINYFENLKFNGKDYSHKHVPSSSLVPYSDDQTLLFTNAGMVQFKDVFLGKETLSFSRAVTCQRCVRAGGKHNDLENVGYTKRHHTFFEMLGNFSFGDYFKREAIHFAWNFLTKELEISPEKLWVTVHEKDQEAAQIWREEIKVNSERFSRCGDKDNFWAMGETGPCGYCSEIFYDHGEQFLGYPPGKNKAGEEDAGDRYVEIWNLVFMEFERDKDGNLTRLPRPSVDTGMGLERIAAVMQGVHDNYDIDVFTTKRTASDEDIVAVGFNSSGQALHSGGRGLARILCAAFTASLPSADQVKDHIRYDQKNYDYIISENLKPAIKAICDHARAAFFLIADGIVPSNETRGYVLRKIIRRAVRFLDKIGYDPSSFSFANLSYAFCSAWLKSYKEMDLTKEEISNIFSIISNEEQLFLNTLAKGKEIFEDIVKRLKGDIMPGEQAFVLYDTYGFPLEVTRDMAKERGLSIDEEGFNYEMEKQRKRSRAASKFGKEKELNLPAYIKDTIFIGYEQLSCSSAVLALYESDGSPTDYLKTNQAGIIILDQTPFYAESGGQVGDIGELIAETEIQTGEKVPTGRFEVTDTKKQGKIFLHCGIVREGTFSKSQSNSQNNIQKITAQIDQDRRLAVRLNHSAAHLMHAALHQVIGKLATQRGSMVDDKRLRFDFSHNAALSEQEIKDIEGRVNKMVRANAEVSTAIKSLEDAKKEGVIALFGEKYGETVRVVKMGNFSKELCAGTHVKRTGDIGLFKIASETGVAAGIRRIEAFTGINAINWIEQDGKVVDSISTVLKVNRTHVQSKVEQMLILMRELQTENGALKAKIASYESVALADKAIAVNGIKILAAKIDDSGADNNFLRKSIDQLKLQLQSAVILLASIQNDKINLAVGVTKNLTSKISANDVVKFIAPLINGSGGGRADMAQGGGTKIEALNAALDETRSWIEKKIL